MNQKVTLEETRCPTFLLKSRAETGAWGDALGKCLQGGDVIALIGDLGTGKTTLTQAIARGMGIIEPVSSPTFTLVQEYSGRAPLFHFDPYRLERAEEMTDLGFEEYLERGGVVVVEWADKIEALLPDDRLTLRLELLENGFDFEAEDTPRLLTAEASGPRGEALLQDLLKLPELTVMQRESGNAP